MIIHRREFLRLLGISVSAAGLGCDTLDWFVPDRLAERALRGPGLEEFRNTPCGLCEGGCGLTVRLVDGLPVGIKGNPNHPLSRGGLCPVGHASLDLLYSASRLRGPLRRSAGGELGAVGWPEALGEIAGRLAELRRTGRGDRIVFVSQEPSQIFHDLLGRIAGSIGSAHVVNPAQREALPFRLMQGIDVTPGFDLAHADLVLSFGLDLFEDGPAPVHAIVATIGSRATEDRAALIHVGTRLSPSAAKAEVRVPIQPGSHGAMALGVAHVLVREGAYDRRFVSDHTFGFEDWTDDDGHRRLGFRRLLLERYYPDRVAQICGCDPTHIVTVARRFARASAPLAVAGGEATSGSNGTWTAMAVHALNALAGAFDRDGGVVLPAPMALTPLAGPPMASPSAGSGLFDGITGSAIFGVDPFDVIAERVLEGTYPVEALVVISSNPVRSSPAGERLRQAMARIPTTVVLAPFLDETARAAQYVLPTSLFMESWHEATTPSTTPFSVLGVGEPVVEPLHDTRHPGDVLLELARRIGDEPAVVPWPSYVEYLKDRVRGLFLSGQGAVVSGSFEESWVQFLEERGWRFLEHGESEELWSDLAREGGWWNPVRPRGDWARLFRTGSGRFEFFSRELEGKLKDLGRRVARGASGDADALRAGIKAAGLAADGDDACLPHYEPPRTAGGGDLWLVPFRGATGRSRIGTVAPMVAEMFGYPVLSWWETWAELAPATAHQAGVSDGDVVAVESDRRSVEAVVRVQAGAVPGVVHMPLGFVRPTGTDADGAVVSNPVDSLMRVADTLSGGLALTATRVRLRLVRRRAHGGPAPKHEGDA